MPKVFANIFGEKKNKKARTRTMAMLERRLGRRLLTELGRRIFLTTAKEEPAELI